MISPSSKLSRDSLLPAVCGKMVCTRGFFIRFIPLDMELELDMPLPSRLSWSVDFRSQDMHQFILIQTPMTWLSMTNQYNNAVVKQSHWSSFWKMFYNIVLMDDKRNESTCLSKALGRQDFQGSPERTYLPVDWSEPSVVGLVGEPWSLNSENKKTNLWYYTSYIFEYSSYT